MLLTQVAECQKDLQFRSREDWPEVFPAMAWKGHLLTGFKREQGFALDLSDSQENSSFLNAVFACYPRLSLTELAEVYERWYSLEWLTKDNDFSWTPFFAFYGLRDSEILRQTLKALYQMPEEFLDWAANKGLGPKDLSILRSFREVSDLHPAALWIAQNNASKSTGVQCLEVAGELRLMGHTWENLLPQKDAPAEQWLKSLESQRYPMSQQKLVDKNKQLMRLPWPAHTQARWMRRGDETGLEIRLQVRSSDDLKKKLAKLQSMEEVLDNKEESLWNQ